MKWSPRRWPPIRTRRLPPAKMVVNCWRRIPRRKRAAPPLLSNRCCLSGRCARLERTVSHPPAPGEKAPAAKLSLLILTTVVVGSMVGAGVFSLPQRFAEETGVWGALVAWLIAGSGMLMLAFVFQRLSMRKPALEAGIFSYAKAGFGNYVGFFSAAGYWASACVGNVTYWVLTMSTLGALFPQLGAGDTSPPSCCPRPGSGDSSS